MIWLLQHTNNLLPIYFLFYILYLSSKTKINPKNTKKISKILQTSKLPRPPDTSQQFLPILQMYLMVRNARMENMSQTIPP